MAADIATRAAWSNRTNILCIRLDNLGDVLMTTPAFRALRTSFPDARLTLLTSTAGAAIARYVPEMDDYLEFAVPWTKQESAQDSSVVTETAAALRERLFDAAVIFTTYSQSALPAAMLCYLAGIGDVLGYCRENPYRLMRRWVPEQEPFALVRHEVRRQLDLVATVGARRPDDVRLSLRIPVVAIAAVRDRLMSAGLDFARPWLVLHAGASEPKRQYRLEDYAAAAQQLYSDGWQIVLTGSEAERPTLAPLLHALRGRAFDLVGQLTMVEWCAVLDLCDVLVSNNTGSVHIAAALRTPVVVLYAQTNPQHTPWRVPHKVLYFAVAPGLRSKSPLLQDFLWPPGPQASPSAIVAAVHSLQQARMEL